MSDMWSATPTFAARKKRMMTAPVSILILLGGALAAVVMAQPASATTVPNPPAGWTTVFSDNFAGAAGSPVNSANWKYDTGPGSSFGTGEIETMTNFLRADSFSGERWIKMQDINANVQEWMVRP
jgi:hypothetical protein